MASFCEVAGEDSGEEVTRRQIDLLKKERDRLENELREANGLITKLETDRSNLSDEIGELKKKLGNEQDLSADLKTRNVGLLGQLKEADGRITGLKTDCDNFRIEVGELKEKLGNEQDLSADLKTQKDGLRDQLKEADGRITEVEEEVKNLKTMGGGLMKEFVKVQRRNDDLEKKLEQAFKDNKQLTWDSQPYQSAQCCVLMLLAYYGVGFSISVIQAARFTGMRNGRVGVNALYFMIITSFTIGFGDIAPCDAIGKLITCIFVMLGVHVVNCLTAFNGHLWTKVKIKYLSDFDEAKRSIIIHCLAVSAVVLSTTIGWVGIVLSEHGNKADTHKHYSVTAADAFYLASMALSTEGFGDISFKTTAGRAFATIWLLIFQPLFSSAMKFLMDSIVKNMLAFCCQLRPF